MKKLTTLAMSMTLGSFLMVGLSSNVMAWEKDTTTNDIHSTQKSKQTAKANVKNNSVKENSDSSINVKL